MVDKHINPASVTIRRNTTTAKRQIGSHDGETRMSPLTFGLRFGTWRISVLIPVFGIDSAIEIVSDQPLVRCVAFPPLLSAPEHHHTDTLLTD